MCMKNNFEAQCMKIFLMVQAFSNAIIILVMISIFAWNRWWMISDQGNLLSTCKLNCMVKNILKLFLIKNRYKWAKFEEGPGKGGQIWMFSFAFLFLVCQSALNSAYKIKEIVEKSLILRKIWTCKLVLFYTTRVLLIWIILEIYEFFYFKSLIPSRKCL